MKLFKKMIAMALLCTLLVSMVACGGGDVLKGKWTGTNDDDVEVVWTFDGKGGCTLNNPHMGDMKGEYTVEGSTATIKLDTWDDESIYEFVIDGNNLNMIGSGYSPSYELKK